MNHVLPPIAFGFWFCFCPCLRPLVALARLPAFFRGGAALVALACAPTFLCGGAALLLCGGFSRHGFLYDTIDRRALPIMESDSHDNDDTRKARPHKCSKEDSKDGQDFPFLLPGTRACERGALPDFLLPCFTIVFRFSLRCFPGCRLIAFGRCPGSAGLSTDS